MEVRDIVRKYSSRVRKMYELGGVSLLLTRASRKILYTVCNPVIIRRREIQFSYSLVNPIPRFSPPIDVVIRQAGRGDYESLREIMQLAQSYKEGKIEDRFSRNNLCFIAKMSQQILHYSWVSFNQEYDSFIEQTIQLDDGVALIYDCYTRPDFRGRNIFPATIAAILQHLRSMRYQKVLIGIGHRNYAPLKSVAKLHFDPENRVTYVRAFKLLKFHRNETLHRKT